VRSKEQKGAFSLDVFSPPPRLHACSVYHCYCVYVYLFAVSSAPRVAAPRRSDHAVVFRFPPPPHFVCWLCRPFFHIFFPFPPLFPPRLLWTGDSRVVSSRPAARCWVWGFLFFCLFGCPAWVSCLNFVFFVCVCDIVRGIVCRDFRVIDVCCCFVFCCFRVLMVVAVIDCIFLFFDVILFYVVVAFVVALFFVC
jgi:hypothetical protein